LTASGSLAKKVRKSGVSCEFTARRSPRSGRGRPECPRPPLRPYTPTDPASGQSFLASALVGEFVEYQCRNRVLLRFRELFDLVEGLFHQLRHESNPLGVVVIVALPPILQCAIQRRGQPEGAAKTRHTAAQRLGAVAGVCLPHQSMFASFGKHTLGAVDRPMAAGRCLYKYVCQRATQHRRLGIGAQSVPTYQKPAFPTCGSHARRPGGPAAKARTAT
jgi:hypothetical protein